MDFHDAWNWLNDHPMFTPDGIKGGGADCLQIDVVKVNPESEIIEDNDSLNVATRVWLEGGPWTPKYDSWSWDYRLDCGGNTFEEAFLRFVELVKKHYHDYGDYSSLKYGNIDLSTFPQ